MIAFFHYFLRFSFAETKGSITLNTMVYQYPQFLDKPRHNMDKHWEEDSDISEKLLLLYYNSAILARENYMSRIKQAFGFGFIRSFFPFTKAFEARKNYVKNIARLDKLIDKEFEELPLTTSSWFFFLHPLVRAVVETYKNINISLDDESEEDQAWILFKQNIPFLWDVLDKSYVDDKEFLGGTYLTVKVYYSPLSAIGRLLHTFLNPFKLGSDILSFLNYGYNAHLDDIDDFLDYFFTNDALFDALSRFVRFFPNYIVFLPLRLIGRICETLLDIVLFYPIKVFLVTPLTFLIESIYHTLKHWNYTFENIAIDELDDHQTMIYKAEDNNLEDVRHFTTFKNGVEGNYGKIFVLTTEKKEETCSPCFSKDFS